MPTTVRSFRTTEATEKQITALHSAGYGNLTNIIRTAIDRMAREEKQAMKNSRVYDYCTDRFGNVVCTYTLPEFLEMIEELRQTAEDSAPHINERPEDDTSYGYWYDPAEWEIFEDIRQDDETGEWHDVVFVGDELALISVDPS